jgi:hypothetical protein
MQVVFLLAAEQDLQQAYNWVAEHRLGDFLLADAFTEAGIAGC